MKPTAVLLFISFSWCALIQLGCSQNKIPLARELVGENCVVFVKDLSIGRLEGEVMNVDSQWLGLTATNSGARFYIPYANIRVVRVL